AGRRVVRRPPRPRRDHERRPAGPRHARARTRPGQAARLRVADVRQGLQAVSRRGRRDPRRLGRRSGRRAGPGGSGARRSVATGLRLRHPDVPEPDRDDADGRAAGGAPPLLAPPPRPPPPAPPPPPPPPPNPPPPP